METRPLPILRSVALAYEELGHAWRAPRPFMLRALLIILAAKVAEDFVPRQVWSSPLLGHVVGFAIGATQSFCLAPIVIAIHRFIILDEVTSSYAIDPSQPSLIAFFSWLLALSLLSTLVFLLQELLTSAGLAALTALVPTLMVVIAVTIVTIQLTILFPTIAVDARGSSAAHAIEI
jgi:hypothetical protein